MTHSDVWHYSFIRVTWLIYTCDKNHSQVWHDSLTCLIWLIQMWQHVSTHWNTPQLIATHCNTLQYIATHCNALQRTATHCNTLQHIATPCNIAAHCTTLQHTATHCITHTAGTRRGRHPARYVPFSFLPFCSNCKEGECTFCANVRLFCGRDIGLVYRDVGPYIISRHSCLSCLGPTWYLLIVCRDMRALCCMHVVVCCKHVNDHCASFAHIYPFLVEMLSFSKRYAEIYDSSSCVSERVTEREWSRNRGFVGECVSVYSSLNWALCPIIPADFSKKLFRVKRGRIQKKTRRYKRGLQCPVEPLKTQYSAKILRLEFRTWGGARQVRGSRPGGWCRV